MCAMVGSAGEQESETTHSSCVHSFPDPKYNHEIRLLPTPEDSSMYSQPATRNLP